MSSLPNSTITILPNSFNPINSQTFTIQQASTVSIQYASGLGQNVVQLTLDNNLALILDAAGTPLLNNPSYLF